MFIWANGSFSKCPCPVTLKVIKFFHHHQNLTRFKGLQSSAGKWTNLVIVVSLGSRKVLHLPQLSQKVLLAAKVVESDLKIIILLHSVHIADTL